MIELNKWFFVQLLNFLILTILLNFIFFKPLLRLFKQREDHIKNSLNDAKIIDRRKEELLQQIETRVSEARNQAKTIFEELHREGIEIQKQILDSAKKEAEEMSNKARKELEDTVKKTRENLRREVGTFSKKIVEKMVGV